MLSDQFSQMNKKKQDLQTKISVCDTKMESVIKLIAVLSKTIFFFIKIFLIIIF